MGRGILATTVATIAYYHWYSRVMGIHRRDARPPFVLLREVLVVYRFG
jgi:hypothetical protein